MRQIGFLRAGQIDERCVSCGDEIVFGKVARGLYSPINEIEPAGAHDRVNAEQHSERIDRLARRHGSIERIAVEEAADIGPRDRQLRRLDRGSERNEQTIERDAFQSSVEPMARFPIGAVAPYACLRRECGKGSRVPAPDMDARRIDHRSTIDRGGWIGCVAARTRRIEMRQRRFYEARLHQIVTTVP